MDRPSVCFCLMFCSWLDWFMRCGEKCSCHHIISRVHGGVNLHHLAEAVFARFLSCKVTLLPPFYAFRFGYQSLCMAHAEGAGSYAAPPPSQSVYTNYLNSSSWETCLFSSIYLLIQSFVHTGVDSLRVFVNITPIQRHGFWNLPPPLTESSSCCHLLSPLSFSSPLAFFPYPSIFLSHLSPFLLDSPTWLFQLSSQLITLCI